MSVPPEPLIIADLTLLREVMKVQFGEAALRRWSLPPKSAKDRDWRRGISGRDVP